MKQTLIFILIFTISCTNSDKNATTLQDIKSKITISDSAPHNVVSKIEPVKETNLDVPLIAFQLTTILLDSFGYVADSNRLKIVGSYYQLKSGKVHEFNNKPFYQINLEDHPFYIIKKYHGNNSDYYNFKINYDSIFRVKNIWGYFYRKTEESSMLEDGVIEQWCFNSSNEANYAYDTFTKIYPDPFINTEPYYIHYRNYFFILYTRNHGFSRNQKKIYKILCQKLNISA